MGKQKETTVSSVLKELFNIEIYKRSQGRITRQVTGAALAIVGALGCYQLHQALMGTGYLQYVLPLVVLAACLWLSFRVVCIPQFADFLIATEAEMNKVSWPARGELIRGSAVVLVTIFILAILLFVYDIVWHSLLTWLGVLPS